jgi:inorganic triphosphatase YgiF
MSELELKFQVPAGSRVAVRADLAEAAGATPRPLRLQATYFDTPDALLGRHRIALRLRREGPRWVQTLKAAKPHSVDRLEENVDRGPVGRGKAAATPALDLDAHRGSEAGALLSALLAAHPEAVLVARYATDIRRAPCCVKHGQTTIEIAFDEGEIVSGAPPSPPAAPTSRARNAIPPPPEAPRRAAVSEIEFELVAGPIEGLFALAADWQARHGLWLDVVSKAERGERLAAGVAHGAAVGASAPRLERRLSPGGVLRRVVAACLAQVLPNVSALAHGSTDTEHVHQARVGLRRLRTALRDVARGPARPLQADEWEGVLAQAFHELGSDRDATTLPPRFSSALAQAGAPLTTWLEAVPSPAPPPSLLVRSPAFQRALLQLLAFAEQAGAPGGAADARQGFARRLSRLHAQVTRDIDGFESLAEPDQHVVRKRLKRLRYLAEFAAPLFGTRAVARYLDTLKPAQDVLGRLQDEAVALAHFREAAARDPRALFAIGWFEARRASLAHEARRALKPLARVERFWR